VKNGMRLLRGDGWKKVREGSTTLDAVISCTAH
jgi:type II secretory ATPase GspE/PulE/Tfp pilus assembly ATPase PilB-like protein